MALRRLARPPSVTSYLRSTRDAWLNSTNFMISASNADYQWLRKPINSLNRDRRILRLLWKSRKKPRKLKARRHLPRVKKSLKLTLTITSIFQRN